VVESAVVRESSELSNNRMKLTSGEGCARPTGAHSRALRAASWVAARSLSWCSADRGGATKSDPCVQR